MASWNKINSLKKNIAFELRKRLIQNPDLVTLLTFHLKNLNLQGKSDVEALQRIHDEIVNFHRDIQKNVQKLEPIFDNTNPLNPINIQNNINANNTNQLNILEMEIASEILKNQIIEIQMTEDILNQQEIISNQSADENENIEKNYAQNLDRADNPNKEMSHDTKGIVEDTVLKTLMAVELGDTEKVDEGVRDVYEKITGLKAATFEENAEEAKTLLPTPKPNFAKKDKEEG